MKEVIIKLNQNQKKAITMFTEKLEQAEELMTTGAQLKRETNEAMWMVLRSMFPELDNIESVSLHRKELYISGVQSSAEVIHCKKMKHECVERQDFEEAAKWRDKECKAIEKMKVKTGGLK